MNFFKTKIGFIFVALMCIFLSTPKDAVAIDISEVYQSLNSKKIVEAVYKKPVFELEKKRVFNPDTKTQVASISEVVRSVFDKLVNFGSGAIEPIYTRDRVTETKKEKETTPVNNVARRSVSLPTYAAPTSKQVDTVLGTQLNQLRKRINDLELARGERVLIQPVTQNIYNTYTTTGGTYSVPSAGTASTRQVVNDIETALAPLREQITALGSSSPSTSFSTSSARASISVSGGVLTYDQSSGVLSFSTSSLSTSDLVEGTNLYFTNARVDARINAATSTIQAMVSTSTIRSMFSTVATGLSYDNSTGLTSLTSGYAIPLTASTTEWALAYASTTNISTFWNTPSTRIAAGTGLSWSGNTLTNSGVTSIGGLTGAVSTSSLGIISSQWGTSGTDVYYNLGNVGIGTSTPSAALAIKIPNSSTKGLIIQAASSQSVNPIEVLDSSGTQRFYMTPSYALMLNVANATFSTSSPALTVKQTAMFDSGSSGTIAVAVKGRTGQTADLQQWLDVNNSVLGVVTASGSLGIGTSSPSAKFAITGSGTSSGKALTVANSTNSEVFTVTDNGTLTIRGGGSGSIYTTQFGQIYGVQDGVTTPWSLVSIGGSLKAGLGLSNLGNVYWNSGTAISGTPDLSLNRNAAGVLEINNGTTGTWRDLIVRNLSMGTTSTSTTLFVQAQAGKDVVDFASSTGSSLFRITQAGNVGIGTTSSNARLTVFTPNGTAVDQQLAIDNGNGTAYYIGREGNSTGRLYFTGGLSGQSGYDFNGPLYSNGNALITQGVTGIMVGNTNGISAPSGGFRIAGSADGTADYTIARNVSSGALEFNGTQGGSNTFYTFSNSSTELLRITGTGNVGIGTTTPTRQFSVISSGIQSNRIMYLRSNAADGNTSMEIDAPTGSNAHIVFQEDTADRFALGYNASATSSGRIADTFELYSFVSGAPIMQLHQSAPANSLVVGSTGNLGIGTTTPGSTLTVAGDINLTGAFRMNGNAGTSGMVLQSTGTGAQWVATSSLGITGGGSGTINSGTSGQVAFYNSTGTTLSGTSTLFLLNENVGVGSTTPFARLSVAGVGTGSGVSFQVTDSSNAPKFTVLDNGNVGIRVSTNNADLNVNNILTVDTDGVSSGVGGAFYGSGLTGKVVISGASDVYGNGSLTVHDTSGGSIAFAGNPGGAGATPIAMIKSIPTASGLVDGTLTFHVRNSGSNTSVEAMRIISTGVVGSTGNLGIGTTTPGSTLTVAGDINLTGAFRMNGNAGTSGMVLQSTGTGAQWVATSSLGITGGGSLTGSRGQIAYFSAANTVSGTSSILLSDTNVTIGNTTASSSLTGYRLVIGGASAGTAQGTLALSTPGVANSERSSIAFFSNFTGTADYGPRRTADIVAGMTQPSWSSEYLAFHVGNNGASNDAQALTAEKMRISQDGTVGIGTTSPQAKLAITGFGTGTTRAFAIANGSNVERFTVLDNGSVGIGTTSPVSTLAVVGTSTISGGVNILGSTGSFLVRDTTLLLAASTTQSNIYVGGAGNTGASGSSNTAIGFTALQSVNSSSANNVAVGRGAGMLISSGQRNIAVGMNALDASTSGPDNVAIGYDALTAISTSISNTAVGSYALNSLTSGHYNVALGMKAGYTLTGGTGNIVIGSGNNGDGVSTPSSSSNYTLNIGGVLWGTNMNTVSGASIAAGNIGIGTSTPHSRLTVTGASGATTDLLNVSSSTNASYFMIKSTGNVGIGTTTPVSKLAVADGNISVAASTMNIGLSVNYTGSGGREYQVLSCFNCGSAGLGGLEIYDVTASASRAYIQAGVNGWQTPSDMRLKDNISTLHVLDKINLMRGTSYVLKDSGIMQIGVIAQEIKSAFPEAVSGEESEGRFLGVNYNAIAAIALQGVKELHTLYIDTLAKVNHMTTWFSDEGDRFQINGMVCVDNVCVTKEQFKMLLIRSGDASQYLDVPPTPVSISENPVASSTIDQEPVSESPTPSDTLPQQVQEQASADSQETITNNPQEQVVPQE